MKNTIKPNYSFSVDSTDEIDIERIEKDTPEDVNAFVVLDKEGTAVLLAMRKSFLSRFREEDGLKVGGETLSLHWGYTTLRIKQKNRKLFSIYTGCKDKDEKLWSYREAYELDLEKVQEELKAAQTYKRRIAVAVKYL